MSVYISFDLSMSYIRDGILYKYSPRTLFVRRCYNTITHIKSIDGSKVEIKKLFSELPTSLKKLDISNLNLTFLPDNLPSSVEELNCERNPIIHFPDYVFQIKTFIVDNDNLNYLQLKKYQDREEILKYYQVFSFKR